MIIKKNYLFLFTSIITTLSTTISCLDYCNSFSECLSVCVIPLLHSSLQKVLWITYLIVSLFLKPFIWLPIAVECWKFFTPSHSFPIPHSSTPFSVRKLWVTIPVFSGLSGISLLGSLLWPSPGAPPPALIMLYCHGLLVNLSSRLWVQDERQFLINLLFFPVPNIVSTHRRNSNIYWDYSKMI